MRKVLALMGILAMFGFGSAAAEQTAQPKDGQKVTLKVSGMACSACAATVEKAAKTIDGVIAVKASQPTGSAEITYDAAKTSPEAIAKALNKKTSFKAEVAPRK
jgi:copper chaperone